MSIAESSVAADLPDASGGRSRSPRNLRSSIGSAKASDAGSSGTKSQDVHLENAQNWPQDLSLSELLTGAAKGIDLYGARRTRDSLQKKRSTQR